MVVRLQHSLKTSNSVSFHTVGKSYTSTTATSKSVAVSCEIIDLITSHSSDYNAIYKAIAEARREKNKPTIIRLRTTIGYGSKQQGTHGVHGSRQYSLWFESCISSDSSISTALKADDIQALKSKFGFNPEEKFVVPQQTYELYSEFGKRGAALELKWTALLDQYAQRYPKEHAQLTRRIAGRLPDGWEKGLPVYKSSDPAQAS